MEMVLDSSCGWFVYWFYMCIVSFGTHVHATFQSRVTMRRLGLCFGAQGEGYTCTP